MEKPIVDIYKSLRTNRIITLSAVITAGLTIIVCVTSAFRYVDKMTNFTYNKILAVNGNGEVVQTQMKERTNKEIVRIEIADHLDKWFERFYTYDFNNVRKQPLRGQWIMASEDFNIMKKHYESWHKEVENKKLSQKTIQDIDSVVVMGDNEPYAFKSSALLTISNGYSDTKYRLNVSGKIITVEPDYPKNPHGFLIIDYKEKLTKLEE